MNILSILDLAGKTVFNLATIGGKQVLVSRVQNSMKQDVNRFNRELDEGYEQYVKPNFKMLKDK